MNLKLISISALTGVGLLFSVACGSAGEARTEDPAGDAKQTVQVADAHGHALSVTVLNSDTSSAGSYADIRINQRQFQLAQWVDAESGALHNVVSSADNSIHYEAIVSAAGTQLSLSDAGGKRMVAPGESLGKVDTDAAALLLNFRAPGSGAEIPYYQTYCVGYDTSDPSDWHLTVGSCTCAHWYSVICTMN